MLYRLNKSRREPNVVDIVSKCTFDDKMGSLTCYPLRISNVDVGVEKALDVVGALCHLGTLEYWGHISMISVICEEDRTRTVDIGFSDLEDALAMWSRNGREWNGHHWDIQPISGVLGYCYIFRDPTPLKPLDWRLERLTACSIFEHTLQSHCENARQIEELQTALSRLATAHSQAPIPDAHLPPGMSLRTLLDGPHLFRSVSINQLAFSIPEPVLGRMYMTVKAEPAHWSFSSDHEIISGGFYRHGVYDRLVPRKKETWEMSGSSKRHLRDKDKIEAQPPPDMDSPAKSREMTSRERMFARRYTRSAAKKKHTAWNSSRLPLPELPTKPQGQTLIDEFMSIWEWYEECTSTVHNVAAAAGTLSIPTNAQDLGARVVQQSFLAACLSFAPGSRFKKLFGSEYTEIMTKVVQLRDSVPAQLSQDGTYSSIDFNVLSLTFRLTVLQAVGDTNESEWEVINEGASIDSEWSQMDSEMPI